MENHNIVGTKVARTDSLEKALGSEHYETQATRTMLERSFPEAEDPP